MIAYFFTGSAPLGSVAFDIAAARHPDVDWRKLTLDTKDKQAAFEAEEHAPDLILSFLNPYIVPGRYLEAVGGRAYNVHPSPPAYPGNDPQHFAVYDGVYVAGATLHVMLPQVDAGPICAVAERPLDPSAGLTGVREVSAALSLSVLLENLPRLVDGTIEPSGHEWRLENKRSRADFLEMCRIEPGIDADELRRRIEAFYQPTYRNKPYVELHGMRFVYDPEFTLLGARGV